MSIIEGTWEELAARSEELRRYPKLKLIIPDSADEASAVPNQRMLNVLGEIADRQKSRPFSSPDDSDRLLREARAGGMYGNPSGDA